ncbi:DUF262 domain-containing protein [Nitratiruptor tergarcus]|uniref:Uncharacterized conserved protein, contains ParB-like and HNH nuclease domains n=1 Tax=Nitratiruptor tergarcus DSM 16512 TaxID=1069081 RepID=A0A1W1WS36_9BACT|nr:DUF262 domain-containing protein [Nitratiruptor tergarcus]SMC09015.1 Uncharacterized conserved protein, contains ParB-like and HNH nuclease domains [Nitratiruptor tergarcus DSM 16512]
MQEGKLKFKDIFDGDKIFEIPEYQRAYTWEEKQLVDFLHDLKNQRIDKPYFFGTFLFHEAGEMDEFTKIYIVDGQQRITTSVIFIKAILDFLNSRGQLKKKIYRRYIEDEGVFKLNTSNNDNSFFHTYIINHNMPTDFDTKSQIRLFNAKRFFEEEINKLNTEIAEQLLQKLENSLVLVHTVNNKSDAAQIFELINDRGKRLTDLEAIKSFLMYQVSITLNRSEQLLGDIENNFAKIYRKSESLEGLIKEEQIIMYYVISSLNWTGQEFRNPKDFIKEIINQTYSSDNKIKLIKKISKELKESFEIIEKIVMNSINAPKIDDLFMLNRIANFYPLLMGSFKYDKYDDKRNFREIASLAELYAFISLVAGKRADTGVKYFYELARDFKGDFVQLYNDIKIIFRDNWWRIITLFKENVPNIDFYDGVTKYILFKYENYLRKQKGFPVLTKKSFFENDSRLKLSIEHITAKKAKNLKFTEEFEESYLHNIGNLVIDTVASNSSKGNNVVDKKIEAYNLAPLISHNEIDKIVEELSKKYGSFDWNNLGDVKRFIEFRREKIKEFIFEEWNYNTRAMFLDKGGHFTL